jgi:hypothetical protein
VDLVHQGLEGLLCGVGVLLQHEECVAFGSFGEQLLLQGELVLLFILRLLPARKPTNIQPLLCRARHILELLILDNLLVGNDQLRKSEDLSSSGEVAVDRYGFGPCDQYFHLKPLHFSFGKVNKVQRRVNLALENCLLLAVCTCGLFGGIYLYVVCELGCIYL